MNYKKNNLFINFTNIVFYQFIVHADKNRIDKFLINILKKFSRNTIQKAAKYQNIRVNGKIVKSNYNIRDFDFIEILIYDELSKINIYPENIPIDIIFEDKDLLIINKSAGMIVHPGNKNYQGTLLNALFFYLSRKKNNNYKFNNFNGLVHRIDKETSGLLLFAKNEESANHLKMQFFNHSINRIYWALVWGDLKKEKGRIKTKIGRDLKCPTKMKVYLNTDKGKEAITHYRVIERFIYFTLIECKLETGRTHQIRVHMQYIGHPLFNDSKYGGVKMLNSITNNKKIILNYFKILSRHALHAKTLGFIHPKSDKKMFFNSELPKDMQTIIHKIKIHI